MKERKEIEDKTTEERRAEKKKISKGIRKHKRQQIMELIKEVIKNNRSLKVLKRNTIERKDWIETAEDNS